MVDIVGGNHDLNHWLVDMGDYWGGYHSGTLPCGKVSATHFKIRTPVVELCRCLFFKWVAGTWFNDRALGLSSSNVQKGKMPYYLGEASTKSEMKSGSGSLAALRFGLSMPDRDRLEERNYCNLLSQGSYSCNPKFVILEVLPNGFVSPVLQSGDIDKIMT